jgi:hypothetical protein
VGGESTKEGITTTRVHAQSKQLAKTYNENTTKKEATPTPTTTTMSTSTSSKEQARFPYGPAEIYC